MSVDSLMPTLLKLSVTDRRQLIARLEETLPENQDPIELDDATKKLLDERLAEMAANPDAGIPLDEYLARFRKSS